MCCRCGRIAPPGVCRHIHGAPVFVHRTGQRLCHSLRDRVCLLLGLSLATAVASEPFRGSSVSLTLSFPPSLSLSPSLQTAMDASPEAILHRLRDRDAQMCVLLQRTDVLNRVHRGAISELPPSSEGMGSRDSLKARLAVIYGCQDQVSKASCICMHRRLLFIRGPDLKRGSRAIVLPGRGINQYLGREASLVLYESLRRLQLYRGPFIDGYMSCGDEIVLYALICRTTDSRDTPQVQMSAYNVHVGHHG